MRSFDPPGLGGWILRGLGGLIALWLIVPVLVVIPLAFNSAQSFKFPPQGLSLRWFDNLVTNPEWRSALTSSLTIALVVVVLALTIGTACALGLDRSRVRGKPILRGFLIVPLIVPVVVGAVGVYSIALRTHLIGTTLGFVLAHTALALPFVIISVSVSLAGFDRRLELAAANLGASPLVTFVKVTLPIIAPGVIGGAAFAFITSFDEVVTSLFLSTPFKRTVPVMMFQNIESVDPTIAAASTLVLFATTALLILAFVVNRSRRRSAGIAV